MSSDLKVLQVIPKLGYGGAETGCYDIAHYLPENNHWKVGRNENSLSYRSLL